MQPVKHTKDVFSFPSRATIPPLSPFQQSTPTLNYKVIYLSTPIRTGEIVRMTQHRPLAKNATVKCVSCNVPVTQTVDGEFVCGECGAIRVAPRAQETERGATTTNE